MSDILSQIEEIQGNVRDIKATWGNTIMTLDNIKSSLKADRQKAIEETYQKGFEAGQHEATTLEYQQGLNDAWECMKAIAFLNKPRDMRDFFGCSTLGDVLIDYTASEAIEKLKAYEEQQKADERIMLGDGLVTKHGGVNGIALSNEVNRCVYVWREDCVAYAAGVDEWKKTGKTYPQVAELHEAMKEGAE